MEQTLLFEPIEPKSNKVQVFNSPQFGEIRMTVINDKPCFCLVDICRALGIDNPRQVKTRLKPDGCYLIDNQTVIDNDGLEISKLGNTKITYVNLGNLNRVIFLSRKEGAVAFQDLVYDEILPSIETHGVYATDITVERAVEDPDFLIGILTQLKEEKSKRKEIEEQKRKQEERNKYLTSENARLERKGKWVDHQTGQDETLYTFEAAAKTLGVRSGKKLILFLTDHEFIFRRYDSKHKVYDYYAHAAYAEKGLFRIVYDTPTHRDGTPIVNPQTNTTISTKRYFRITELGLAFIQMKLEEAGLTKKVIGTKEKYEKLKEEYENKE